MILERHLFNRDLSNKSQKTNLLLKDLAYLFLTIILTLIYINENNLALKEYRTLLAEQNKEIVRFLS